MYWDSPKLQAKKLVPRRACWKGEDPKKSEEKVVRKKRKFAPHTDIEIDDNSAEENPEGESCANIEAETTPPNKRMRVENPPKTPRRVEFQDVEVDNNVDDTILSEVPFLSQPTRNLNSNFNNIFDSTHLTGTPGDSRIGEHINVEETSQEDPTEALENDIARAEQLMCRTNIKDVLAGDQSLSPVLQIQNVEYMQQGHCYRAVAHDSRLASNKFVFSSTMNRKVKEHLLEKHAIIEVTKFKLYNNRFVFIQQFEVLYDFPQDIVVSNPYVLNDKD